MEENRLKPMVEGYDPAVFNDIYSKTEGLRRKLASQIDTRRFGVDYNEVLSWFDVKFLHAFNVYYGKKDNEMLKGYIINSLQFFKQRILRFSYSNKAQIHNTIDLETAPDIPAYNEIDDSPTLLKLALQNLKATLSEDAFRILLLELDPPLYILSRLSDQNKWSSTKIPSNFIADYLGWGEDTEALRRVALCKKEIQQGVQEARVYFSAKAEVV